MFPILFVCVCLLLCIGFHAAAIESHNADVEQEKKNKLPVPVSSVGALPGEALDTLPLATNTTYSASTTASYPQHSNQHLPVIESVAFNLETLPSLDSSDFQTSFEEHESHDSNWSMDFAD